MYRGLEKFYTLVEALETLPAVGKKSALRLALHMILSDPFSAMKLSHAITEAVQSVKRCTTCGNISEHELCDICSDERRETHSLCIVATPKDILTIEETASFHGLYFVFDAVESPTVERLITMITHYEIHEIIFAFTPSVATETMIYYIEDKLSPFSLTFTKIAQGVPTGVSLENVDILSLSKAIQSKVEI